MPLSYRGSCTVVSRERDFEPILRGALPVETAALARALIGYVLVRESPEGVVSGRIVETEAYPPGDPAGHHFVGKTERNASLFLAAHYAYVYQIYGTSFCFNLSSEEDGTGGGVLVRALEPIAGVALMQRRRGVADVADLCRGPGRLCRAFEIDRALDGVALFGDAPLFLSLPDRLVRKIGVSRRIGVTRAASRLLRYYERGNRFVSGPKTLNA
jgi:DNA-3-methyladenine glycosylase